MTDFPCFPPCNKCRIAGECATPEVLMPAPKPVVRSEGQNVSNYKPYMADRASYAELACGHLTTGETQAAYSAWRPHNRDYYCEACSKWVLKKPKPEREALPAEPMF